MPRQSLKKALYLPLFGFFGYKAYAFSKLPKPMVIDQNQNKTIVIIGTGITGLLSAYYLSKYPKNNIVVLERNHEPYKGTSHQNGNWMPVNYNKPWLNIKLFPGVFNAIFKSQENMSKIYLQSAFESFQNFLIMTKFAFYWFFT